MGYGSSAFGSDTYGGIASGTFSTKQITFTIDANLLGSQKSFSIDAVLSKTFLKTTIADAILIFRKTFGFNLTAALQKIFSTTFTLSAMTQRGQQKTFSIDAVLVFRKTTTHTIDAQILKTLSTTFKISARVYVVTVMGLPGYKNRKLITIPGSTDTLLDFQIPITVFKGAGTDTTTSVYLNQHVKDDFSDIRFTKQDGESLLPYWIEKSTPGISAKIWIKVDYIPASPDSQTIYIYYNNPAAAVASNPYNTMDVFSDYTDVDSWIGQTVTINENRVRVQTSGNNQATKSFTNLSLSQKYSVEMRFFSNINVKNFSLMTADNTIGDRFSETLHPNPPSGGIQYSDYDLLINTFYPTFVTGTIYRIQHVINTTNLLIDYYAYDENDVSLASILGRTHTHGTPVNLNLLSLGSTTVSGTGDEEFYWIFIRKFIDTLPSLIFGLEESFSNQRTMSRTHRVGLHTING